MFPASVKDNAANDSKMGNVRSDLENAASDAGKKVRQYYDNAGEEINEAVNNFKGSIRSNPIQSSIIALTAGFVIGALLRR